MGAYIIRRLLSLIPVLLGITFVAFVLGNLAAGDPAIQLYIARTGEPPPNNAVIEELREELGLNDPLLLRYFRWLAEAARGQFGSSYRTGAPVLQEIAEHSRITFLLATTGIAISFIFAVPLGVIAAAFQDRWLDIGIRMTSFLGAAMPSFWLSYVLILIFSVRWHLLPVSGMGTWRHLVLPTVAISFFGVAVISRLLRASMLEVLHSDFTRTARAKGLPYPYVLLVHVLRNSLIPVVTITGSLFGSLVGGAVIIETIFALPGLGRLIIQAISFRDYPIIQGFVVFTGAIFLLVNLLVDLSYTLIDPRVRLTGARRN